MNTILRNSFPAKSFTIKRPVKILYEDDYYIVFDKPAGLLVIPSPKNEQITLTFIVNMQFAGLNETCKLHPCHRIDQDTSGAIMYAKGKRAQRWMMDLFKTRAVHKKYIAFIHGKPKVMKGEFRNSIKDLHHVKYRRQSPAIWAITTYRVLKVKRNFSIVEVRPITGRTNQIRIHFSMAGHPLVGERKYAFARDYPLKFRRTALHAAELKWVHPVSHKKICVRSNLPKDRSDFISIN